MLYAFKLGPIETGEGFTTTYVGMTPNEALPPLFVAHATEALKSLADQAGDLELRCEPALARAGKAIGFEPATAPEWVAGPRAVLAWGLAMGNGGGKLLGAPIPEFLHASAAFMKAKPWRHWDNEDIVELDVTGARERTYEASIMGCGGEEYGIALYEEKGAIAKLTRFFDAGRMHEAAKLRSIAVTMDDEPMWAIRALKEVFGLARVPVPIKVARGAPGPVDALDLVTLTAALRAIAQLSPRRTEASARLPVEGVPGIKSGSIEVRALIAPRPFA